MSSLERFQHKKIQHEKMQNRKNTEKNAEKNTELKNAENQEYGKKPPWQVPSTGPSFDPVLDTCHGGFFLY